jgi:SAM-dependent methyltransferase
VVLNRQDLENLAAATLAHYGERAEDYARGTRDHDVSRNIHELLRHIEGAPPFRILDLGCGPGRDLETFRRLGHEAVGLDGQPRFAARARQASGRTTSRVARASALRAGHEDAAGSALRAGSAHRTVHASATR